jgi:malonyl-CoA O-methyltransferase
MSLTFHEKIIRDFSRAARNYDIHAILQRKVSDRLFNIIKSDKQLSTMPNSFGNILDIGCGTGYFHELLRKSKIYAPLWQTDISQEMCKIAALYSSPPEYGATYTSVCDMHHLPFADKAFSTIFSSMAMQWSENLHEVFLEAKRVLTKNGRFFFSIVGDGSLQELKKTFTQAGFSPPVHDFLSLNDVKEKLITSGFREIEISDQTIIMHYENIQNMLREIKNIGASYKSSQAKGLRGRGYFLQLEKIYNDRFLQERGLPLSWNIIYVSAKP